MKERVYFPNYVENDISSWVLSPDKEAIESLYHPCPVTGRDSVSLFESSIMIADRILNEGVPYAFCATAIKYLIQAILKGVLDPHHPTTLIKYSDPINPDIPNLSWRIYQNELQQFTISRWGKGIYRDEELQPTPLKTETSNDNCANGVSVSIPHTTKSLDAIFQVMRENWTDPDLKRLPKQINIAREIDKALGYSSKGDPNKTPSRVAVTLASIIKPDTAADEQE